MKRRHLAGAHRLPDGANNRSSPAAGAFFNLCAQAAAPTKSKAHVVSIVRPYDMLILNSIPRQLLLFVVTSVSPAPGVILTSA